MRPVRISLRGIGAATTRGGDDTADNRIGGDPSRVVRACVVARRCDVRLGDGADRAAAIAPVGGCVRYPRPDAPGGRLARRVPAHGVAGSRWQPAWAVGEGLWCYQELWLRAEDAPLHALADGILLLLPLGAGAALLLLSIRDSGQSQSRLILDGMIVAISLFIVSWVVVLDDVVHGGGDSRLITLMHLLANVAVATIAIMAWARARPAHRPSLGLLCGGVLLIALSDSLTFYLAGADGYHTGSLIDLCRLAGFAVLALAALSTIDESPVEPSPLQVPSRARMSLPYLPLLLAGGFGLGQVIPDMALGPFPVMAVVLVLAVLARQFVVLVENQRLLSDVAWQAFRDGLTGLANRALFLDRSSRRWTGTGVKWCRWQWCAWISTTSRRSTTFWATPPATNY